MTRTCLELVGVVWIEEMRLLGQIHALNCDNSSWLLGTFSSGWHDWLFPQAELLVALGIMGLWTDDYRTLPMSTTTLFLMQAICKLKVSATNTVRTVKSSRGQNLRLFYIPWDSESGITGHYKDEQKTVLTLQDIYKLDPYKSLCHLYIQFSKSNVFKYSRYSGKLHIGHFQGKKYSTCLKQDTI